MRKDHRMETPKTIFIVEATEYERDWGQRPNGYFGFLNEADAKNFVTDQYFKMPRNAPDVYVTYELIGYKEATPKFHQQIALNGRVYFKKLCHLLNDDHSVT